MQFIKPLLEFWIKIIPNFYNLNIFFIASTIDPIIKYVKNKEEINNKIFLNIPGLSMKIRIGVII